MIARHRRKAAAQWAGLAEVPAVIRELDDNQAIVAMVDSNLQRENLKPSEKAFAYASLTLLFFCNRRNCKRVGEAQGDKQNVCTGGRWCCR